MSVQVVFDSKYGNTGEIARQIARCFPEPARVIHIIELEANSFPSAELTILGSPTHGADASEPFQTLFEKLTASQVRDHHFAVFDTRLTWWFLRPFGYAAPKMARRLRKMGGKMIGKPAGFVVTGGEGPLAEGEQERAEAWAQSLVTELHPTNKTG